MLKAEFEIPADEQGVVDGRDLAKLLIARAHEHVAPYADGDYARASQLFSAILLETLAEIEERRAADDTLRGRIVARPPGGDRNAAFERHAAATLERTERLLAAGQAVSKYAKRKQRTPELPALLHDMHAHQQDYRKLCRSAGKCVSMLAELAGVDQSASVRQALRTLDLGARGSPHEVRFPAPEDKAAFKRLAAKRKTGDDESDAQA